MKNILLILIIVSFSLAGCDNSEEAQAGDVRIDFKLMAGNQELVFDDVRYTNEAGNEFSVNSFWMYVSNITLIGAEGTEDFSLMNDYNLIEGAASVTDLNIALSEVDPGNYASIQFSIGVDEPTNTDISAIAGELDPARAWNWNTGYKFVSLEGSFFPEGEELKGLVMHIGLAQNYKTITRNFTTALSINGGISTIDLSVDILKMFEGVHTIDFAVNNSIKAQPVESGKIADNYAAGMIELMD